MSRSLRQDFDQDSGRQSTARVRRQAAQAGAGLQHVPAARVSHQAGEVFDCSGAGQEDPRPF
eukprot:2473432-Rhodomonas_salina.1